MWIKIYLQRLNLLIFNFFLINFVTDLQIEPAKK